MRPLRIVLGDLYYFNKHTRLWLFTPENLGFIAEQTKNAFGNQVAVSLFKDPQKLLDETKTDKPDIVGLALYFWNSSLNHTIVKILRERYGKDLLIVFGGASVDSDPSEQRRLLEQFPEVDFLVPNEGEEGFVNIVRAKLAGELFHKPIDGAVYVKDGHLVAGEKIGLKTDLTKIGSPYLKGHMDEFIKGPFQPLVQTSRLCPYTCTFCVSGKNVGKLRAFPVEQIKEEITFIAKAFVDRPHFTFRLSDENFGILKRDVEIAEHILKCHKDIGWPQNVFFYNDKRFTKTAREVVGILGCINNVGMALSLQTENPEALMAIKRTNITSEEIDEAIQWASERNILASTELIFGLPFETKDSFVNLLERSVARGFDSVNCNNLMILDGTEMVKPDYRRRYELNTKFRLVGANFGEINGVFSAEHSEIVVASKHFSFEDYMLVRCLNLLFYGAYTLNVYKWFFNYIRHLNVPLVKFFTHFTNPDLAKKWPEDYLCFIEEVKTAFKAELFDTKEELKAVAYQRYKENGNDVGEPDRLNVYFASRMVYTERHWLGAVFREHVKELMGSEYSEEINQTIDVTLELCNREWINPRNPADVRPLPVQHDFLGWKKKKYKTDLNQEKFSPRLMKFFLDESSAKVIETFDSDFNGQKDKDYYYYAFDFIMPRRRLKYILEYESI